jgi:uncharacterized protein DUF3105
LPKALRFALALVVALAAVVGLLLFVQSRDRSTFSGDDAATKGGPGKLLPDQGAEHRSPPPGFKFATDPPASGPHLAAAVRREAPLSRDQLLQALETGDVLLFYSKASDEGALRGVAEDVAGPFDPALAGAGQAVLVERRPGTDGVIALAWRRMLKVASATDPQVHAFADAWLGKGKPG